MSHTWGVAVRFESPESEVGQIFAVCGTRTLSFGIAASSATTEGLLGFAVERVDPARDERFFMSGFKVFPSIVPHPQPGLQVSTFEHPVQSFIWDDFTAEPDHEYTYLFHPVKGKPRNLDRSSAPLSITVRTEPLESPGRHQVFFNRGAASSQAYQRWFGTTQIDKLDPDTRARALAWLSGDLGPAMIRFIDSCSPGDTLLGCFYEFRHLPIATAFKAAIDRGVQVQVIVDTKDNSYTDKKGIIHESFPREANLRTITTAGIPTTNVLHREARPSNIAHNKYMVRLTGTPPAPAEVWTGSTNVSDGGISGQTNVGHWIRDPVLAGVFAEYWTLLSNDPAAKPTTARRIRSTRTPSSKPPSPP